MIYNHFEIMKIILNNENELYLSFNEDVIVARRDKSLNVKFERYEAHNIERTAIVENGGFGVNNSSFYLPYDDKIFTKTNFETNFFKNNKFYIYKVNRDDIDEYNIVQESKLKLEFSGIFGNFKQEYDRVEIELRSNKQLLLSTVVDTTKRFCINDFCDSHCSLNINDYKISAKIVEKINLISFKVEIIDKEAKFTENQIKSGYIKCKNGLYKDYKFDIKNFEDNVITISSNINLFFKDEQEIIIVLGCDKTKDTCKALNNVKNFGGFSFIPVSSKLSQMGTGNYK